MRAGFHPGFSQIRAKSRWNRSEMEIILCKCKQICSIEGQIVQPEGEFVQGEGKFVQDLPNSIVSLCNSEDQFVQRGR